MGTNAIPDGYGTVTPWIICKDSAKLIEFLERAFNAKELPGSRIKNADGSIGHVEPIASRATRPNYPTPCGIPCSRWAAPSAGSSSAGTTAVPRA